MHYLQQQCYIKEIIIEPKLVNNIYEISKQYSDNIFLVVDKNTLKFLNKKILDKVSNIILPANVVASLDIIELVKNKAKSSDLIIALGSGTINDICKYTSYIEQKEYILFPTAASMNGYTSATASISVDGYKRSFTAHLAKAIYIDTDILTNAPIRLTLSGFADFICRSTAQADWLLSHLLLGTQYNELPFIMVNEMEQILLKEYQYLNKKSSEIVVLLMQALLISGFGMVISDGSYSASQGEHIIAHAMDIVNYNHCSLHGEKIAVTTMTMGNLQEKILSIKNPIIQRSTIEESEIIEYFGINQFTKILEQKKKYAAKCSKIVHEKWKNIFNIIQQNILPTKHLEKIFSELSMPYLPEHLGWNQKQYHTVANLAFATRDRFTFLDLANCIIN
ncbi:glycerol-1-phosphate dehydrogenase [Wolbachia pipientis]|uniref:Glycerol-1-phosphate dehydrogenase n=1 Tax=Wolbachia pipientis TaxID=955 RepID=A0A1E7QK37_WOLPI|nr:iron-containing alcohol dehydrogenase [Wolbachia pipientis]OEY86767.1 glycerol-1-phosphate dehydrogenase [Wolbachia pipientis]